MNCFVVPYPFLVSSFCSLCVFTNFPTCTPEFERYAARYSIHRVSLDGTTIIYNTNFTFSTAPELLGTQSIMFAPTCIIAADAVPWQILPYSGECLSQGLSTSSLPLPLLNSVSQASIPD